MPFCDAPIFFFPSRAWAGTIELYRSVIMAVAKTAVVNKLLDSHAGRDIYRCMHALLLFTNRKNSLNAKRRQLKLGTNLA